MSHVVSFPVDRAQMTYPKPIVVNPPDGDVKATCIFLHGLGDSGNGWADVAGMMPLPGVKWVFPTAPQQPVTINMGMVMNSWYDFNSFDVNDIVHDRENILKSADYLKSLVDAEVAAGVPAEKVLVGGFSQGGAIALTMAGA